MTDSGMFRVHAQRVSAPGSATQIPFDADGGVDLRQLKPGTVLEVQTKNNVYSVVPQASGESLIWGHPELCPEPILIAGLGSAYDSGLFRESYLGPGMRLSFPLQGRRVSTSRIIAVQAKPKQ